MVKIGDVVVSFKGRDKGKMYIVCRTDKFAYVTDGHMHKLSSPKKKNFKHIKTITSTNCPVANMYDCDIIHLLKKHSYKEDC